MQQPAGRNAKTGNILHDIGTVTHKDVTSEAPRIFECSALIRSALHQVSVLQIRMSLNTRVLEAVHFSLQIFRTKSTVYCIYSFSHYDIQRTKITKRQ